MANGSDIYFVRSSSPNPIQTTATFRVSGKHVEFWHSDSGTIEPAALYRETADGRTDVEISFEPFGSLIVVFRPGTEEHLVELTRDGQPVSSNFVSRDPRAAEGWVLRGEQPGHYRAGTSSRRTLTVEVSTPAKVQPVEGNWTIHFPAGWGAPEAITIDKLSSWTENANPGVRFFSGTATYTRILDIPAEFVQQNAPLWLSLGDVRELARVKLNGQDLGITWKKPFRIALNGAAKPGKNTLEVSIVNLWPNRLIGDQQLPIAERFTRTNITKFKADSPLLPSGLLGPVELVSEIEARFVESR